MRIQILDGFRGFFLLFMMIIHLNVELETILGKLNHHYFGFVEDAQGFVFISGIVVGLVYGGIILRKSYPAMQSAIWKRIRTIWLHQATLICLFLITAVILLNGGITPEILRPYQREPVVFSVASISLVTASKHMGILPMYIWFMVVTPLVLRIFAAGYGGAILVLSILLWSLGQTGVLDWAKVQGGLLAAEAGYSVRFGIFFNLLGWQTIYIGGLWLGFLHAQGRLNLDFLKSRTWTAAAIVAVFGVLFFGLLDRVVHWHLVSQSFSDTFRAAEIRADFSTVHVVNFALDLFLITWLVVAGKTSGIRLFEWLSHTIVWVFTRPALVFLGQHSLHVFSFHLVVVYIVAIIYDAGPPSQITGSFVLILCTSSLYLAALYNANKARVFGSMQQRMTRGRER